MIGERVGVQVCNRCGAKLQGGRFCGECGLAAGAADPTPRVKEKPQKRICPKCGAKNSSSARFCSECGNNMNSAPVSHSEKNTAFKNEETKFTGLHDNSEDSSGIGTGASETTVGDGTDYDHKLRQIRTASANETLTSDIAKEALEDLEDLALAVKMQPKNTAAIKAAQGTIDYLMTFLPQST